MVPQHRQAENVPAHAEVREEPPRHRDVLRPAGCPRGEREHEHLLAGRQQRVGLAVQYSLHVGPQLLVGSQWYGCAEVLVIADAVECVVAAEAW